MLENSQHTDGRIIIKEPYKHGEALTVRIIEVNVVALIDQLLKEIEDTEKKLFLNWGIAVQLLVEHITQQEGFSDFVVTTNAGLNFMTEVSRHYQIEQVRGVMQTDHLGQPLVQGLERVWDQEAGVNVVGKKIKPGIETQAPGIVTVALEHYLETDRDRLADFLSWLEETNPQVISGYVRSLVERKLV